MFLLLLTACALHSPETTPGLPAAEVPWLDHAAYPFTSHFLDLDGARMHYLDEGQGDPVVLVHGTPSWSWEWRAVVADLARDHRAIAPDHLGFGLSDSPAEAPWTPAWHAENLARLLDGLDLHHATVVVHDFGGPIGLPWVLDHADRVDHLVVVNSWLWGLPEDSAAARGSRKLDGALGRTLYLNRNVSPRRMIPWSVGAEFEADAAFLAPYVAPFPTPARRVPLWRLAVELDASRDWYEAQWARRAALAPLDLRFVWGVEDPAFGEEFLARWTEAFPQAPVTRLAAGHFPQEERPAEFVAALRQAIAAR